MGSSPGNKPSHGGNSYKIKSMVATVLSLVSVPRKKNPTEDETESRAYARAEQEQSDFEKAKGSVDEGPVYESKKRVVAVRPSGGRGDDGASYRKAREGGQPRWKGTE